MITTYLFDWGDTLMVDFPGVPGKMCDWERVQAVDGAAKLLASLSHKAQIYIATGAAESTEADIKQAFERVDLAQYVSGYFCQSNLGCRKGSKAFLPSILTKLAVPLGSVAMVGDSIEKDVKPALEVGIQAVWLKPSDAQISPPPGTQVISSLTELL